MQIIQRKGNQPHFRLTILVNFVSATFLIWQINNIECLIWLVFFVVMHTKCSGLWMNLDPPCLCYLQGNVLRYVFSGACCIVHTMSYRGSCECLLLTYQSASELFQSGIHPSSQLPSASITTPLSIAAVEYWLPSLILKLPPKSWRKFTQLLFFLWWDWKPPITLTVTQSTLPGSSKRSHTLALGGLHMF